MNTPSIYPSQNRIILRHLQTGKTLTNTESMYHYGISEGAKRISELRELGYNIDKQRVTVRNRNGKYVQIMRYTLLGDDNRPYRSKNPFVRLEASIHNKWCNKGNRGVA